MWWVAAALAQDPEPLVVQGSGDGVPIIVVEAPGVTAARQALLDELARQGYGRVKDKGDHLVLHADQPWKGRILVYDDGWATMKLSKTLIASWPRGTIFPPTLAGSFEVFPSKGKRMGIEERALEPAADFLGAYGDRVADVAVAVKVAGMPDRLEALWNSGVPIEPNGPPLLTTDARKAALLAYWESRTDTIWGDRVRASIDAFIRAEVQGSNDAFTDAEIEAFNARRRCERDLDLRRDWEAELSVNL